MSSSSDTVSLSSSSSGSVESGRGVGRHVEEESTMDRANFSTIWYLVSGSCRVLLTK